MNVGILDPYLLACPNGQPPVELLSFARKLLALKSLKSTSFFRVVASPSMAEALAEVNGHPVWSHVMAAMQLDGAVDPRDVITLFNSFLQRLEQMDSVLGIREVIASQLDIQPFFYGNRHAVMRSEFEKICLCSSVYQTLNPATGFVICVLTEDLPGGLLELAVEANAELVEMESGEMVGGVPFAISQGIAAVGNADDAWKQVDPVQAWRLSRSSDDFKRSIEIYVVKTYQMPFVSIPIFFVGSQFVSSIFASADNTCSGSLPILRACAETLMNENMRDTHVIRTSHKATSPQLFRGRDGAWRRDIDRDRHLHYWLTAHGPELAKVTITHDDMEIPE